MNGNPSLPPGGGSTGGADVPPAVPIPYTLVASDMGNNRAGAERSNGGDAEGLRYSDNRGFPTTTTASSSPATAASSLLLASSNAISRPSVTELNEGVIARLGELATAALSSTNKDIRDSAAQQLLFLSSYEYWDTLRVLLPRTQNNHLRFIIVKGLLFLVSNELGPQERTEMQTYVLEYMYERRCNGEQLPYYLRNALFAVFASALFSNWKISIIRADSAEQVNSSEMAEQILALLQRYLTTEETLDCVLEILTYFARQNARLSILSVKSSFAKQVLPLFFSAAVELLSSAPEKAALVCSTALECTPEQEPALIRLCNSSDPSITVLRWPAWAPALLRVINECGQALLDQPEGPLADLLSRLLRQISAVTSPQEEYIANRDDFANILLELSGRFLLKVQENPARTELLRLACALLVNTFVRNDEATVAYLARDAGIIRVWADATRYVLGHPLDEEKADLRQALLHLFFIIGDRMLPPKLLERRTLEDSFGGCQRACTPPRADEADGMGGAKGGQPLSSPPFAPRGPLSSERTREVEQLVVEVFSLYVDVVISTAHEREESQELRTNATFVLQTERMLQPIAEMLFCERIDLLPQLVDRLKVTIHQYEVCVRAREEQQVSMHQHNAGLAVAGGAAGNPGLGSSARSLLQELCMTLAVPNMSVTKGFSGALDDSTAAPLFFTHVCLSRLSVIISIFAIALLQGTASRDDNVLGTIAAFARELLGQEDQVTENLLQCLSLLDDDGAGLGGGAVGTSRGTTAAASSTTGREPAHAQVHVSILRSLFFFCGCVYETNLSRCEDFYDITVNLLCYVYRYHSNESALVVDANVLLTRIVDFGSSGTFFLGSEKLRALMEMVKEDQLPLLHVPPAPAVGGAASSVSQEVAEARHGFLTAFTFYVETRYYAGFPVVDAISAMTERCLGDAHMQANSRLAFQDLRAISKGIHQPDTLHVVLSGLLRHREICSAVVRYDPAVVPDMIAWLAVLCSRSVQYMDDENLSTTPWELTSLVMNVLCLYFGVLSYPPASSGGTMMSGPGNGVVSVRSGALHPEEGGGVPENNMNSSLFWNGGSGSDIFFSFPTDAASVAVVYDTSDILNTFCCAPWCNLGILLYYERATVEHFFCGAVELLTTTSVQHLMADEGRSRVFNAIMAAVNSNGDTFQQLHLLYMRQGVWNRLVRQLTKCLSYMYAPELVSILYSILVSDQRARYSLPQYKGLEEHGLAAVFHEICTLVAVAPHLSYREMAACFGVLQVSYHGAKMLCGECADRLLDMCSAYHRVRLRLIINSLRRDDGEHLMTEYMTYFGQSSNVGVLTAW